MPDRRFDVVYRLAGSPKEALSRARDICLEQTVELPDELVPRNSSARTFWAGSSHEAWERDLRGRYRFSGRNSRFRIDPVPERRVRQHQFEARHPAFTFETRPGLVEVLFGSPFRCRRAAEILGIPKRPILCTALKPMGFSPADLSNLAYKFALGGIDLIKDDHGLTDQPYARFKERVRLCARAVEKADRKPDSIAFISPT